MSHKFEIDFGYDTSQNGRQDVTMLRSLKNFNVIPVDVQTDEEYRSVTVGVVSEIANGVNLLNALKESVKSVGEKNVKLSAVVYSIGKNLDFITPATVSQEAIMDIKKILGNDANEYRGGFNVSFDRVENFDNFMEKNNKMIESLKNRGVEVEPSKMRKEMYDVNNYADSHTNSKGFAHKD